MVDRPNWAHDRKTEALTKALRGRYRIVKAYQDDLTASDLESADATLLYYWLQRERLDRLATALDRIRDRLLIGICSHFELEGDWRDPGLATLATARAVFANSRPLQREFEPLIARPVYYTPNGVETTFFQPGPAEPRPPGRLRVGWAGSLSNCPPGHRGVEEFIAPAVAAVDSAELLLACREDRWRDRDAMLEFYRSLDVYVCASESEGTPNPCLEAAACGVPVITTRVGNMPELIREGENGLFVERDVSSIAAALVKLRDDEGLRTRMGTALRRAAEGWDWRFQARHYEAMVREVLPALEESPSETDR